MNDLPNTILTITTALILAILFFATPKT